MAKTTFSGATNRTENRNRTEQNPGGQKQKSEAEKEKAKKEQENGKRIWKYPLNNQGHIRDM